jgi:hypothetical protein
MKISHGYNAIEFGAVSLSLKSSGCVVLAYRDALDFKLFFVFLFILICSLRVSRLISRVLKLMTI